MYGFALVTLVAWCANLAYKGVAKWKGSTQAVTAFDVSCSKRVTVQLQYNDAPGSIFVMQVTQMAVWYVVTYTWFLSLRLS